MSPRTRYVAVTLAVTCLSCGGGSDDGTVGAGGTGGAAGAAGGAGGAAGESTAGAAGESAAGAAGTDAGSAGAAGSAGPESTHGSGGLPCTQQSTQWESLPYCAITLGDIELKLFVPAAAATQPVQLAVYLHGDTANGYYEDWGFEALAAWALEHDILFAAALAPNGCSWWRPVWSCSVDEYDDGYNADQLAAAFARLGEAYDVYREEALFVGYSGGSTFLTRHFVPMYGNAYPGVMVLNCGGVPPQPFSWALEPDIVQTIPLHYTFGTADFMTEYIYPSMQEYEGMGFAVEAMELAGYGHCDADYDWDGRTLSLWDAHRVVTASGW